MSIEFTPRLQQILTFMLEEDKIIPVQELAEKINVSKRTVQRELGSIEKLLKKHEVVFRSKTGTGVWLEGSPDAKYSLYTLLKKTAVPDSTDRTERRKRLILEILKDKDLKKLYYYSNLLGVSEATISSDLEEAAKWFKNFHLTIIRRQGYGVSIEGSEKNYRLAMRAFIEENIDTHMLQEFYEDKYGSILRMFHGKDEKNIYSILNNDILKRVVSCLLSLDDKRILNLTETSYVGLVLHITIAINRILKEEIIAENDVLLASLKKDEDYELALYITSMLEKEFHIQIPEIENAYICLHIQGAKRQYADSDLTPATLKDEQQELMELIVQMTEAYDKQIAYILLQDEEFVKGLLAHLQPTCIRLKNNMKITNPLLDQIKKDYTSIYKKCTYAAAAMKGWLGQEIPDSEIGFLAIHFGAATVRMEEQKENKRKVHIGVICASGIGISRLMSTKLKKHFLGRAEITAYSQADLPGYVLDQTDFFVSSITFHLEEADILLVSPLLVESDMDAVEEKVKQYERTPDKKKEEINFQNQLEQINYMAVQIKEMIKDMQILAIDHSISFSRLLEKAAGSLAPEEHLAAIIQNDLAKREEAGTQIFPAFGFALLHTKTSGIYKPNFSVCIPEGSSTFSNPYFKNIRIIICMLLPKDEHLKENSSILGYLSETLIESPDFLDQLCEGSEEEIRSALSSQLKIFFNQYMNKL